MSKTLPVEIWNLIFSHFVTGPTRLQVWTTQNGQPRISVCEAPPGLLVHRFLATFVWEECAIKGLYHVAVRFLMSHPDTVWTIRAPCRVLGSRRLWDPVTNMMTVREAIEEVALHEDLAQALIQAIKVDFYTLERFADNTYTRLEFDKDRVFLKAVLERFPNLKTLDYILFPTPVFKPMSDALRLFDTKCGYLAFPGLNLIHCLSPLCQERRELPVRFEIEDENNVEGKHYCPIVTTKEFKRRLITKMHCTRCGQVLSN